MSDPVKLTPEQRFTHSCFLILGVCLGGALGQYLAPWMIPCVGAVLLAVAIGRAVWDIRRECRAND